MRRNYQLKLLPPISHPSNNPQKIKQGNWRLDFDSNELYCSSEILQLFEVPINCPPEKTTFLASQIHQEDQVFVKNIWSQFLATKKTFDIEYKIQLDNNRIRFINEICEYSATENATYCTILDITKYKKIEQELIQKNLQQHDLLNNTSSVIYIKDLKGRYLFVNHMFEKLFNLTNDDINCKSDHDIFPLEMANTIRKNDLMAMHSDEPIEIEETVPHGNSFHTYISIKFPLINAFGDTYAVCGISTNITARKQAELDLMESENRYKSIFHSSVVGIIVVKGEQGLITEWNEGAEKIFNYSSAEVLNKNITLLISKKHIPAHNAGYSQAVEKGGLFSEGIIHEFTGVRKSGQEFPIQFTLSSWKTNGEIYFSAILLDITQRKQAEDKILHQAHYDFLTNLPNRFLSLDRLSQLLSKADRNNNQVAVLFLDLDDFKKINDTLGHEAGDKLLVEASYRLRSIVRNGDTVGRLGGDEFIILLGGLNDATDASIIAENILIKFREAFNIDGRQLILSASLGISIYPLDGKTPSDLLRNADCAMYHSKKMGRNTYSYFTQNINHNVVRRLAIEEQLYEALERNEFYVVYQPQIDCSNHEVICTEALLRWNNPVLGEISPEEFIPITEQTGLIISLGQFVLSTALQMVSDWRQQRNFELRVAVNLSPVQFRDPNLINFIKATIHELNLSYDSLELEITEGVLMSGHSYIDKALHSINDLGINIAMDDFGTGYSSLSYLRNYPFKTLKIDRSFIQDICTNSSDQKLIKGIVAMAHSLELDVVAEGVENEQQLNILKKLNCDFVQGYLFGRPMPKEDMLCFQK